MGNTPGSGANNQVTPVHPHVHGEHSLPTGRYLYNIGSSPRTWGTQVCRGFEELYCRFIPTYMGNTR